VALTVAALLLEQGLPGAVTPRALGAIAWLALGGTVLTYLGLYWLLPKVPLVAVGAIPLVDTTVAVLLGTLVAGERFTPTLAAGAALVLASAALSIRGNSPPDARRGTPGS
jgi:drug/metabolite transporter (DMT)-like permease